MDGLIVRDVGIGNMTQDLTGLVGAGEFTKILQRLDDRRPPGPPVSF